MADTTETPCFRRCEPGKDRINCANKSGLMITECQCDCHDTKPTTDTAETLWARALARAQQTVKECREKPGTWWGEIAVAQELEPLIAALSTALTDAATCQEKMQALASAVGGPDLPACADEIDTLIEMATYQREAYENAATAQTERDDARRELMTLGHDLDMAMGATREAEQRADAAERERDAIERLLRRLIDMQGDPQPPLMEFYSDPIAFFRDMALRLVVDRDQKKHENRRLKARADAAEQMAEVLGRQAHEADAVRDENARLWAEQKARADAAEARCQEYGQHKPEWQPIDSAPKDGTDVLLKGSSWVRTGYWARRVGVWSVDSVVQMAPPTHWSPLPACGFDPPVADPSSQTPKEKR